MEQRMSVTEFRDEIIKDDIKAESERAANWTEFREFIRVMEGPGGGTPREKAMKLAELVAQKHGVVTEGLFEKGRTTQWVSDARQELMYELSRHGWSTTRIGRFLNRDHTTIVHGIRRHRERFGLC